MHWTPERKSKPGRTAGLLLALLALVLGFGIAAPAPVQADIGFTLHIEPAAARDDGAQWRVRMEDRANGHDPCGPRNAITYGWQNSDATFWVPWWDLWWIDTSCVKFSIEMKRNTDSGLCDTDRWYIRDVHFGDSWPAHNLGTVTYRCDSQVAFTATIDPWQARNAGAQWRVVRHAGPGCTARNFAWQDSGDTFSLDTNATCTYHIEYSEVAGWVEPDPGHQDIYSPRPDPYVIPTETYIPLPTETKFTLTLAPQQAIDEGARWRVTRLASGPGCTGEVSAWTETDQTVTFSGSSDCQYLVEFLDVPGWDKPTEIGPTEYAASDTTYDLGSYTYTMISAEFCDDFNDGVLDNRWHFTDQTEQSPAATYSEQDNSLYITAEGRETWTGGDEYACMYQHGVAGDFQAVVKVEASESTATWSKTSIAARNNMTGAGSSAGYVMVTLAQGNGFHLYVDSNNNGYLDTRYDTGSYQVPCWLKLTRVGNEFTGYYSLDGTTWITIGSYTQNSAAGTMDVGMYVASYNSGDAKTVKFDDWCVSEPETMVSFTGYIAPSGAQTDGRWRLYNRTKARYENNWSASNVTIEIPSGDHYDIQYNTIDGYTTPTWPMDVIIPDDLGCTTTCSDTGNYVEIVTTTLATTTSSTTTTTTTSTTTTTTTSLAGPLCVDISDTPLDSQLQPAPANIMFLVDDSGSMDWSFMTQENDGLYGGKNYVWHMSDNNYGASSALQDVAEWESQWSGYNKMYYNPDVDYEPWPTYGAADINFPRSDPNKSTPTLSLAGDFYTVETGFTVDDGDAGFTISTGFGSSTSGDAYLNDYRYSSNTGSQWARWDASFLPEGDYYVYVNWVAVDSRTTSAVYTIHAGGNTYTTPGYSQRINGGVWNKLEDTTGNTVFHFTGPTNPAQYVELAHNVTSTSNDKICADAVRFVPAGVGGQIVIKNAHYFVYSDTEDRPYLVNLDGDIKYYRFTDAYADDVDGAGLVLDSNPPEDVKAYSSDGVLRSYAEELQNFANWFSYYRRREYTAKAAISQVIDDLEGVQVGLISLWGSSSRGLLEPVRKVVVKDGGFTYDETSYLLGKLLTYESNNGTPLRTTLQKVGRYYNANDSYTGGLGSSPYAGADAGGECQQSFTIMMTDGYWNGTSPGVGNVDDDVTEWSGYAPYKDNYSDTLADVAMYYYMNDLSDTLNNLVPTNFYDKATHQHMVTYSVSFGLYGTLNPENYDLYNQEPDQRVYPTWPSVSADAQTTIDDLWHAAVNGRGKFLSAGNPQELIDVLKALVQNVVSRIASGASVAINGEELHAGTILFQSSYSADGWTGDVKAYHVDQNSGEVIRDNSVWSAAERLATMNWDTDRNIVTYNGNTGKAFRFDQLTTAQKAMVHPDPALAPDVLEYLRGNQAMEIQNGGIFRSRSKILGDLVHSAPLYMNNALAIGGNDGMLHLLDADTGYEIMAYVPNLVYDNLSLLPDPDYGHKFFVDATCTGRDIGAKTLLVGGLGKGGKGYYCVDIENIQAVTSEGVAASRIMWEYPNNSTPYSEKLGLGYSFSKAYVVNSAAGWVVIFGNGYASPSESAILYVLDALTGTLLKAIDTNTGGTGACNGMSTPVPVDIDGDGYLDYVYAGDLKGNLWKFDCTSASVSGWSNAYGSQPLFTAKGPSNTIQPITTRPDATLHCVEGIHGVMVFFGTGKYLGNSDFANSDTQTVYGLWDYGDDSDDAEFLGTFDRSDFTVSNLSSMSTLQEQSLFAALSTGGRNVRVLTDNPMIWDLEGDATTGEFDNPSTTAPNNVGWFFDLPTSKERVVRDPLMRDDRYTVITSIPKSSPCSAGGTSVLYELNPCTGGRNTNPKRPTFDINDDDVVDSDDFVTVTDPTTGDEILVDVTALEFNGMLFPPAILRHGDKEILYLADSAGGIHNPDESGMKEGFFYWLEVQGQ